MLQIIIYIMVIVCFDPFIIEIAVNIEFHLP